MRWNNNPIDVSLGIKVFDNGIYRIRVESLKPFLNQLKEGNTVAAGGVRAVCKVTSAPDSKDVGLTYIANLYQHSPEAQGFAKAFLVAGYGFKTDKDGEEQFNAQAASRDWTVDTDAGVVGDGWTYLVGREMSVEFGQKLNDKTQQMNQTAKYMPL